MNRNIKKSFLVLFLFALLFFNKVNAQWSNVSGKGYTGEILSICLLDSTIFWGTEDGIYRSFDGGSTMEHVFYQNSVSALTSLDDTIFALAVMGADSGYVYCSTDKGSNWSKYIPEKIENPVGLAVTKEYIFVLLGYSIPYDFIYRFTRSVGKEKYVCSKPKGFWFSGASAINIHDNSIYVSAYTNDWEVNIFKSTDQGNNWESCINGLPNENITSFASGMDIITTMTNSGNISLSSDAGISWIPLNLPSTTRATYITVDSSNDIYLGTQSNGIMSSTDLGKTWNQKNNGLAVSYIGNIVVNKNYVFANGSGNTSLFSRNKGDDWIINCNTGSTPSRLLLKDGNLFIKDILCGLFRSTNLGDSWEPAMWGLPGYNYPRLGNVRISDITQDSLGLIAIIETDYNLQLYHSSDYGENWNFLSNINGNFIKNSKNLLFAFGEGPGIDRSTDNGKTWNKIDGIISQ